MRSEVIDASPTQRILPRLRIRVCERSLPEREHVVTMLANLLTEYGDGLVVQRHTDRGAALGFVGVNPRGAAIEIDIRPAHAEHVGLPQSRRQREARELSLMRWQRMQEPYALLFGKPTHPPLRLRIEGHCSRRLDP